MPLESRISPDLFLHVPDSLDQPSHLTGNEQEQEQEQERDGVGVIFFITGNPGLVGYYHTFLSLLAESAEGRGHVILGASLGGFEVDVSAEGGDVDKYDVDGDVEGWLWPEALGERGRGGKIWMLEEQVELCLARLDGLVRRVRDEVDVGKEDESGRKLRVRVILMGHSVGAWIALEMVRLLQLRKLGGGKDQDEAWKTEAGSFEKSAEAKSWPEYGVEAAFLLTPTIMEIALSEKGRIAAPLFKGITQLPDIAQGAVRWLRWGIGERWVRWLVGRAMGLDEQHSAVETTFTFLMSERGVRQSLFLAGMEMTGIREDEWGDEVWGVEAEEVLQTLTGAGTGAAAAPRLYFLFAHKDHWVADETRRKIMEKRERRNNVKVVVHTQGLQHAWCLKQSRLVVENVMEEMRDLTTRNTKSW